MGSTITNAIGRKRREGKVRPLQGNSPHDRPVSRGIIPSFRRICDDPFRATPFPLQPTILRHPVCVFQAWRNLSVRCGFKIKTKPRGGTVPPPDGRPRAQVKERVGRTTPFSSSAMSSGRLFLDRVARQQSPSPLHQQPQHNTQSAGDQAKGDISTLPGTRHFYFALTQTMVGLAFDHGGEYTRAIIWRFYAYNSTAHIEAASDETLGHHGAAVPRNLIWRRQGRPGGLPWLRGHGRRLHHARCPRRPSSF